MNETLFPIRELSARTQVNTVTIRAWERRYGLLTPKRTEKGHRLYSEQDVKTVEAILSLIARGVSVGKVKAMLAQTSDINDKQDMTLWQHAITQIQMASQDYQGHILERLIADYFVNYPVAVCQQSLFEPVFTVLQKESVSNRAQRSFIESELLAYTLRRLKNSQTDKSKAQKNENSLLMSFGENTALWPLLFLCLELADAQFNIQLINQAIPLESFIKIRQHNDAQMAIFYQDGLWNEPQIQQAQGALEQDSNLVICGTAAIISKLSNESQIYADLKHFRQSLLQQSKIV